MIGEECCYSHTAQSWEHSSHPRTVSAGCWVERCSPWPAPFSPQAPPKIALLCSSGSSMLWRGPTPPEREISEHQQTDDSGGTIFWRKAVHHVVIPVFHPFDYRFTEGAEFYVATSRRSSSECITHGFTITVISSGSKSSDENRKKCSPVLRPADTKRPFLSVRPNLEHFFQSRWHSSIRTPGTPLPAVPSTIPDSDELRKGVLI
jgi:hypothetical protein